MDKIITDQQILHQVSTPTSMKDVKALKLQQRLEEAMKTSWIEGAGLAAIQIGVPLRYAWYKFKDPQHPGQFIEGELVNPEIIAQDGLIVVKEGCLSIPTYWAKMQRYRSITLLNDGQRMIVSTFEAWIIQHEINHMNGLLIVDQELDRFPKLGRNDLCGCGSNKKYKKCCLR